MISIKNSVLQIYFYIRLVGIVLLKVCLRNRRDESGQPKNILVIRTDRLGDFVLSLPVFANLKGMYPEACITVLVRPGLRELSETVPLIDRVMVYEGFIRTLGAIRAAHFDIVFDLIADWRLNSAVLAYMSGAGKRVGFCGGFREVLLTHATDPSKKTGLHLVELNQFLLQSAGVHSPILDPDLESRKIGAQPVFTIGIHPGGYYASQRWLSERFSELIIRLRKAYDCRCIIIAGAQDTGIVTQIINGNKGVEVLYPRLAELPGIIASCNIFVCNNSGPLHLACALGVPTVSTMGPTDPVRWWPRSNKAVVVRGKLGCMPCQKGVCLRHECMETISVEEMFQAVVALVERIYGIRPNS